MILINGKDVFSFTENDEIPNLKGKILPAVKLLIVNKNYVCQIGHYNVDLKVFEESCIQVGCVLIEKVSVSVSPFKPLYYQKEKLAQYYYYNISVTLLDTEGGKNSSQYVSHIFHGVDKVEKSSSTVSKEFCQTFSVLFSKIIPESTLKSRIVRPH